MTTRTRETGEMAKTFVIVTDRIGRADDELGALLMRNFFYALARDETAPAAVLFMNGGVRLTCEGSEVLGDLRLLAEAGVAIYSCGTCLDHSGLADRLAIGEVGTMAGSVATMAGGADIVTIA